MKCNKVKVLLTIGSLSMGGNEVFVMNLIRNYDHTKYDIDILVYSKDNINETFLEEIRNRKINIIFIDKYDSNSALQTMKKIYNIIKKNKYQIIHINSCSLKGLCLSAIPAFFIKKVKIITHSHNSGMKSNNLGNEIFKSLLKIVISGIADLGFACSDVAGESKYTKSFRKTKKYILINNAIDTAKYIYDDDTRKILRKELGINDDTFIIGNIGRLDNQKNQAYLLLILKNILVENTNIKVLIIGDGEKRAELEEKIREYGIKDSVMMVGNKNDANRYYNIMDCFVMPSYYEGFPFVLTEAQMNGLYCIISDVISRNVNVSGCINYIKLGELDKWIEAILSVKGRIPVEACQKVIDLYDIKKEIKRIESLYEMLV